MWRRKASPAYLRAPAEACRITGLSRRLGRLHDGVDLLEVVDVEGRHAVVVFGGVVEQLAQRDEGHGEGLLSSWLECGTGLRRGAARAQAIEASARAARARALATAASTVSPSACATSAAGADSPKRSMPTTSPSRPTYLRQKSGHAGLDGDAPARRAAAPRRGRRRPGGRRRLRARHRDDARGDAFVARAARAPAAASATSEPVASRITSRRPPTSGAARSRRGGSRRSASRSRASVRQVLARQAQRSSGPSSRSSAAGPGDRGLDARRRAARRRRCGISRRLAHVLDAAGASARPRRGRSSRA